MRELGRRTARDGAALFVAAVLHVALLAAVARVAIPAAPVAASSAHPIDDALDVEVVPDEMGSLAAPEEHAERGAEAKLEPEPGRAALAPGSRRFPRAEPLAPSAALELGAAVDPPAPDAGASATPGPAGSGVATAPEAAEHPIDLGLGANGWQRWLGSDSASDAPPPAPARGTPLVKAPPQSSTGGLQEGLSEADLHRLAGPGGRVVNALEDAAHGEGATAFGVARFAVTVLRTGGVEVRLESASSGEAEWKRVAERAAANLRAKAPAIRPPSDGAHFVVDLSAEMLLVDGRKAKTLRGPHLEATPPRFRSSSSSEADLARNNPTAATGPSPVEHGPAMVELPGVYLAQNGKVCSYRLGVSLLGPIFQGGCELSNLGTKPQRVVHAHVTSQELF